MLNTGWHMLVEHTTCYNTTCRECLNNRGAELASYGPGSMVELQHTLFALGVKGSSMDDAATTAFSLSTTLTLSGLRSGRLT